MLAVLCVPVFTYTLNSFIKNRQKLLHKINGHLKLGNKKTRRTRKSRFPEDTVRNRDQLSNVRKQLLLVIT